MICDLGLIDYVEAYRIQKEFVNRRRLGEIEDSVIMAEHYPVFTIGRSGSSANLLVGARDLEKAQIKVLNVDRGGDITFHGPGQIVIYPILDLRQRGHDLHLYMRDLEGLAIDFLADFSVRAERVCGRTGVWAAGKKIASVGIAASNWITYHGLSINISADLKYFSMINPCGLKGIEVESLERALGRKVGLALARGIILRHVKRILGIGDANITSRYEAVLA